VAVTTLVCGLRCCGERWPWLTAVLYLPRFPAALPLPIVAIAAARARQPWSLALVGAAAWIVVFPLMGFELSFPRKAPGPATIRILSYNSDLGHRGSDTMYAQVVEARPDIVLFQMTGHRTLDYLADHPLEGYVVNRTGEFWMASRFPIVDVFAPGQLPEAPPISASFVRYTIESPLGRLDVYNVHPQSPREGFEALDGRALLAWARGQSAEGWDELEANTRIRERQVGAMSEHARRAPNPVIIAGDTNLPVLSPLFDRSLGSYQDGFERSGTGFGYTFPAHKPFPWMRIDRILAGPELRFVHFEVGTRRASTHYCVIADLGRAEGSAGTGPR